jgi:hypothetical protein
MVIITRYREGQGITMGTLQRAGWSPYWRKYGAAPAPWDGRLRDAQEAAKTANAGAWATAPDYMRDKANETTAPRR